MALRVELIGLYCLILAASSDCAVFEISNNIRNGAIDSTRIDCSCLLVWAGVKACLAGVKKVIGQQLTTESELARTPGIRLSN